MPQATEPAATTLYAAMGDLVVAAEARQADPAVSAGEMSRSRPQSAPVGITQRVSERGRSGAVFEPPPAFPEARSSVFGDPCVLPPQSAASSSKPQTLPPYSATDFDWDDWDAYEAVRWLGAEPRSDSDVELDLVDVAPALAATLEPMVLGEGGASGSGAPPVAGAVLEPLPAAGGATVVPPQAKGGTPQPPPPPKDPPPLGWRTIRKRYCWWWPARGWWASRWRRH